MVDSGRPPDKLGANPQVAGQLQRLVAFMSATSPVLL